MLAEIIVGFLIAMLSGMGVGSAGLFVVWLTAIENMPQLEAQGLNLYFFLFSSSASLFVHIKHRKMFWGVIMTMTAFGAAGALIGTYFAVHIDPSLLRHLFGLMLLFSGTISLLRTLRTFRHDIKKKKKRE